VDQLVAATNHLGEVAGRALLDLATLPWPVLAALTLAPALIALWSREPIAAVCTGILNATALFAPLLPHADVVWPAIAYLAWLGSLVVVAYAFRARQLSSRLAAVEAGVAAMESQTTTFLRALDARAQLVDEVRGLPTREHAAPTR
jgi:hypothetical protein